MSVGYLFISETEPNLLYDSPNGWLWCRPIEGGLEFRTRSDGSWDLVATLPLTNHTHTNLDHLANIVTLLSGGITGSKTIGGFTFTFEHGVLTGFEEA